METTPITFEVNADWIPASAEGFEIRHQSVVVTAEWLSDVVAWVERVWAAQYRHGARDRYVAWSVSEYRPAHITAGAGGSCADSRMVYSTEHQAWENQLSLDRLG